MHCYVAVCNNYAICNTLQTALNCNAVCNTSYFKLRCEGNAICNVLQIASKFYHLKILKRRKKLINCKMHRFNNILLWIQLDTNLFELDMQNSKPTLYLVRTLFCPSIFVKFEGGGALKPICPSVCWFVCPSLCHKNFNLAHIFWSVQDIHVTLFLTWVILWKSPSNWHHVVTLALTLTYFKGNLFCPPGGGGQQLSEFACRVYFYTVVSTWRHQ